MQAMKTFLRYLLTIAFFLLSPVVMGANMKFFDLSTQDMDGKNVALSQFKGKVALVVNTASQCGFTPQYKDLEALYNKYKAQGFVVLGFPSNDFGSQEPGSNAEIKKFCEAKFKVSFPMFSKSKVLGEAKQPVYEYLTKNASPAGEVSWNFEKFLIDRNGNIVGRYLSKVTPMSSELTQAVEKELSKKPAG